MNEIIKVNFETQTMSARELHERLNIKTEFAKWFSRMCEYGFTEEIDYSEVIVKKDENLKGGRPAKDYNISTDMAKEICMIQRTPEGKTIRQYLIDLEKAWNTPEQVMARALKFAEKTIDELKADNQLLLEEKEKIEQKIEEDKPKVDFADHVSETDKLITIGTFAKILSNNGFETGSKRLFSYLREHKLLMKNNLPYQAHIKAGYYKVKEVWKKTQYGDKVFSTTFITGKGQLWLYRKIMEGQRKAEKNQKVGIKESINL